MASALPVSSPSSFSLEEVPLLREIPGAIRRATLDGVVPREFARARPLLRGSRGGALLPVLLSGHAKAVAMTGGADDAREVLYDILGPGDPVCLEAHLGGKTPVIEVYPLVPCRVAFLKVQPFRVGVAASAKTANAALQELVRLTSRRGMFRAELAAPSVPVRLVACLTYLVNQWGQDGGGRIPFGLIRQDFADMAATTVETAIRILRKWTQAGWMDVQRHTMTISDLSAIRRDALSSKRSSG